jgi:hypothetical protein
MQVRYPGAHLTVLLGVEKIFEICLLQRKGHCSERSKMRTTRRHADSANSPRDPLRGMMRQVFWIKLNVAGFRASLGNASLGAGRDQTLPKGVLALFCICNKYSSSVARAESILRREALCVLQGSTLCLVSCKLKGGDGSALHRLWADWAEMSGRI